MRTRLLPLLILPLLAGCSLKTVALNAVADMLSGGTGGSFSTDEDLQFVGDALPFGLKLMESVNDGVPKHVAMKLTLASGFAQYGAVFVEWPAERDHRFGSYEEYRKGLQRAKGFYLRASAYARDGLELLHPGFGERVYNDTDALMAEMGAADVPYLFWTAAGWLLAASSDLEDPEMFGLFPVAGKIMMRAYELDPGWNGGMLPSTLISLAPNLPGGTRDDSRRYYEETLKITGGKTAGPYVSLANAVAVKEQDREQFMELMNKALAIDLDADPDARLANDYAQRRAAFLLEHIDDLIL